MEKAISLLVVISVFFIVGILIDRFILKSFKKLARRTSTQIDDIIFANFPRIFSILLPLAGVYVVLPFFNFNEELNAFFQKIIIFSSIIIVSLACAKFFSYIAEAYVKKLSENLSVSLFKTVIYMTVIVIGILVALQTVGISVTPVLTALGIGGLAIALALQDTLANIFAGVHILITKQVRVGDYIKLESGEAGYVVDIGWRNTKVRMLPNNTVIIPNSKLASSVITNYYLPEKEMSVVIPVSVSYESDLELVEKIVVEVAEDIQRSINGAKRDFKPFIRYREFGDSGITFSVILRVEEFVDQYLVQHEFMKKLKKRFDQEGIKIPYPQRDVWFRNSLELAQVKKKGGA